MRYTFTGKNYTVSSGLRDVIAQKIGKLEKFFMPETVANVKLSSFNKTHKIEVTIVLKGSVIRAEEEADTMHEAVDTVVDKLERQIVKHRKKLIDKHRHSGALKKEFMDYEQDKPEVRNKIVKSKKFAIKPMDAEEACMELELLGHDFFVFRNADTDEVNVVYKRKNGDFGLIEPEV